MTLLAALLSAVQHLPNAVYARSEIMRQTSMTSAQKLIAAIFSLTENERYGFYFAYEPVFIEKLIELNEMPFNGSSVEEVNSHLRGMTTPLKGIGVEITRNGDYVTVWGPGVRRG